MLRLKASRPTLGTLRQDGRRLDRALQKATHRAVDKASKAGHKRVQARMRAAGLGKLDRAVGHSSSLKKGARGGKNAWGAIYAKGQKRADDRGAGALEAYSRGATITPRADLFGSDWLWIPQPAIPKRIRRFKATPALYNRSPLVASIGKLHYIRISATRAKLVVRKVTLSPKDGRAKKAGKRAPRTRIPMKEVVAFVGIKITRRGKRSDQHQIMRLASQMVPWLTEKELADILSRAGG
jgi:hypothetical protein